MKRERCKGRTFQHFINEPGISYLRADSQPSIEIKRTKHKIQGLL
jgi:hypothetical protein